MTQQCFFPDHGLAAPVEIAHPEARVPSSLDEYLFDLNGFLVLRAVLSPEEVADANVRIDAIPRELGRGEWHGSIMREDYPEHRGISYQQAYELGGTFERMIDHPNYVNYVLRFVGGEDYDFFHGPAFIDENFVLLRGPGEAIPLHGGGHDACKRMAYQFRNGRFMCGQLNLLVALTDIGADDGATMVIPGSHKSNLIHPSYHDGDRHEIWWSESAGASMEGIAGAIQVHMNAGDAILFVDATAHGSAKRRNEGERRVAVYRFGSAWNRTRHGIHASPELLARLNPLARGLVHPQDDKRPPGSAAQW